MVGRTLSRSSLRCFTDFLSQRLRMVASNLFEDGVQLRPVGENAGGKGSRMSADLLHGKISRHREVQTIVEATAFAWYFTWAIGVWRHFFIHVGRHGGRFARSRGVQRDGVLECCKIVPCSSVEGCGANDLGGRKPGSSPVRSFLLARMFNTRDLGYFARGFEQDY